MSAEQTMFLIIMNGKYGGTRIQMAPVCLLNDGLLDITMQHGPAGLTEMLRFVKYAVNRKGSHIYRDNYSYFRGRSIKITNKNLVERPRTSSADSDNLGIEENDFQRE